MRYAVDYRDLLGFFSGDPYWHLTRWAARRRMRALREDGIVAELVIRDYRRLPGNLTGRVVEVLPRDG